MPKSYPKGGESRLSLEGLSGVEYKGKVIRSIHAHAEKRKRRTVKFTDGSAIDMRVYPLVGLLIKSRG